MGFKELIVILVIALVVFGTKRIRNIGGDLGSAIKNFKDAEIIINSIIELDNKLNIKEETKEVTIGKEQKKIVPTEMGTTFNEFMNTNFAPIMQIEFTANLETFLDKIAIGKANWITVLKTFYDMFNPIVEKLNDNARGFSKKVAEARIDGYLKLPVNSMDIPIYDKAKENLDKNKALFTPEEYEKKSKELYVS